MVGRKEPLVELACGLTAASEAIISPLSAKGRNPTLSLAPGYDNRG